MALQILLLKLWPSNLTVHASCKKLNLLTYVTFDEEKFGKIWPKWLTGDVTIVAITVAVHC